MDFKRMANAITTDLERIYERIEALTGEISWQIKAPNYQCGLYRRLDAYADRRNLLADQSPKLPPRHSPALH